MLRNFEESVVLHLYEGPDIGRTAFMEMRKRENKACFRSPMNYHRGPDFNNLLPADEP